ncbi:MAG: acetyl-CoA carboxylase biotin carboxyl carrier protein subunit [Gemmatimonadetes bacterium]|nr:acetyl-CoA carboxylase biotin carboxyl carrier protein subunit [Gemmatimonadota bacterium]
MMPGRVISVEVKRGDQVRRGQTVCIIESMKMEQRIASPRDARVTAVRVSAGDPVQRGQTLVELE